MVADKYQEADELAHTKSCSCDIPRLLSQRKVNIRAGNNVYGRYDHVDASHSNLRFIVIMFHTHSEHVDLTLAFLLVLLEVVEGLLAIELDRAGVYAAQRAFRH